MLRRLASAALASLVPASLVLAADPAPAHAAPSPVHARAHSPLAHVQLPDRPPPAGARPAVTPATAGGYIPCDLWNAYHLGTLTATVGTGQTIAVVDPYTSSTAASDFAGFSSVFGLPTSNLTIDPPPSGFDDSAPDRYSWVTEITLDIEWAHAIAPGAQVVLVEARSSADVDMLNAIDYAVSTVAADVVSMSWTFSEAGPPPLTAATVASWDTHLPPVNGAGRGIAYVAAAGDNGFEVNWPALSPHVVAVGGTSVQSTAFGYPTQPGAHDDCSGAALTPGVTSANETVWGSATGGQGTGGGTSTTEPEPSYQSAFGISAGGRDVPDVSMLGDPNTGVALYLGGLWRQSYGGTSLGTPIWAAIIARRNLVLTGNLTGVSWLYQLPASSFNDIVTGASAPNGSVGTPACVTATTCVAKPGYDLVTGRGSPLGVPAAGYTAYFSWFDKASPGMWNDNIHVVNPNSLPVEGVLSLPGAPSQPFSLNPGQEKVLSFPSGNIGGPVKLEAGARVIASQRVQFNNSFNEVRATPTSAAAPNAYFSWFDKASAGMANDNIHIVNPAPSGTSQGSVSIPGYPSVNFSAPAGGETYVSFPAGTIGGPVKVQVASGPGVIASQRVQFYDTFNEVLGQPDTAAVNDSWFTWYDKASPGMWNDNIHLVSPAGASGKVLLPGATAIPFTVTAGSEQYVSFPAGTINGPVHVQVTSGSVLASQRVQFNSSFNEVLAMPAGAVAGRSYFSWFDNASPGMFNDNIHIVNPDPAHGASTGNVMVPGASLSFSAPAGGETYVHFPPGTISGPVQVVVGTGPGVLASQRTQYYDTFNEVPATS